MAARDGQLQQQPDPHHRDFHRRWVTLRPPLRPHASVAAAMKALLPLHDAAAPVLLLGVTPELAMVPDHVVAVDWSARMVAVAWPGDSGRRKAVLGDWRRLPLAAKSMAAAIGDGCFTMLWFPEEQPLLLEQLHAVLRSGGRAIIRCFATPDPGETVDEVRDAALAGGLDFHAFKLRFNMAVALELGGNVRSEELFERFQGAFPDRAALSGATGWSLAEIAEIDAYEGSRYHHCYPSRRQMVALMPSWARARFVETEGYPLAERCPLLVVDVS